MEMFPRNSLYEVEHKDLWKHTFHSVSCEWKMMLPFLFAETEEHIQKN